MYKVKISTLEGIIKQLKANNKLLISTGELNPAAKASANKLIKSNEKQIKQLKDEFYLD